METLISDLISTMEVRGSRSAIHNYNYAYMKVIVAAALKLDGCILVDHSQACWLVHQCFYSQLLTINVTGFRKTDPNCSFGISRITNLKYLTHSESLLLGCSHTIFAV